MNVPVQASLCVFVVAAAGSALAVPGWRHLCRRWDHVDAPGHRKIHGQPIPLAGGFAVFTGWVLGAFLLWRLAHTAGLDARTGGDAGIGVSAVRRWWVLAGAAWGVLLLGAWDDHRDLGAGWKFLGQALLAGVVAAWGVRMPLGSGSEALGFGLTVFWILAVTNAFNLSDNMNGLCAGLGFIGAAAVGWSATGLRGPVELGPFAALIAGGLIGYLPYNYPRASVFLGDAGSQSVGFLLAILSMGTLASTVESESIPPKAWWVAFSVVAVPCLDMVFVTMARTLRGQPFWVGDTGHLSHRLARTPMGKVGAVAALWALGALIAAWARL